MRCHRLDGRERGIAQHTGLVVVVRSVQSGRRADRQTLARHTAGRGRGQILHRVRIPLIHMQICGWLQPEFVLHLVVVRGLLLLLLVLSYLVVGVLLLLQHLGQCAVHRIRTDFRPVRVLRQRPRHIRQLRANAGHRAYISGLSAEHGVWITRCPATARSVGHNWRSFVRSLAVLLHVLGQIRLLGVRFAAVLADVRLQVLRLAMLGNVLEQGGFIGKTLVAGITFEWLVGLVAPRVRLQVGKLGECL